MTKWMTAAVAAIVLAGFPMLAGAADEKTTATAKQVLNNHKDCVVWVEAVAKMQMTGMGAEMGHGQEQKVEAHGVVVDPSGLAVVALSQIDQGQMMAGFQVNGQEIKVKTDFSDVKIRLADGTEVPAKIVMKDSDLDLAFVMPDKTDEKTKAAKFAPLDLAKSGKAAILDDIIVLSRLGKSLDNQPAVFLGNVSAVVNKPRTFYFAMVLSFGSPVFTADGKLLGITVMRKAADGGRGAMNMMSFMPVILPAEEIAEIAKQALTKKADAGETKESPKEAPKEK